MTSLRERMADLLLRDMRQSLTRDRERLSQAVDALSGIYERFPSIVRESMTSSEREHLGEMDSRYADLLLRQQLAGQRGVWESTEADRLLAVDTSRRAYDVDVLMEAIVDSWTSFGFGTQVDVVPRDPAAKPYWDKFWKAPANTYLLGQKRIQDMSTFLLRDGDYLLLFFISTLDGTCTVRRVPSTEIAGGPDGCGIYTLPDDQEVPVLYRREQVATNAKVSVQYYRDWRATKEQIEAVRKSGDWDFSDGAMMDEQKPTTRVVALHVAHKVRRLRGWPLMTTGLPWSTAYKNFLQDRAAIARAAAMYFEKTKVKGGQRAIDALVSQMQSSLATSGSSWETNPVPTAGSRLLENDNVDTTRFPMQTGAGDAQVDGAMLKAQAALAGRMPSHWVGSGQDVQWATAQEMRIPVVRALNGYQLFWGATFYEMSQIVLTAVELFNPKHPKFQTYEVDVNSDALLNADVEQVIAFMGGLDAAKSAGWDEASYTQVMPYLVRMGLQSLGVRNVDDVMPVTPAATEQPAEPTPPEKPEPESQPEQVPTAPGQEPTAAATGEALAEVRPFGADAYERGLMRAVRGLWGGALDAEGFYGMLGTAIEVGLTDAWHAGALKMGVTPEELSPEELDALATAISEENGYASSLEDYVATRNKKSGGKLADLQDRVHLWARRWGEIHDRAMAMAGKNAPMMWKLGPTDAHCVDCVALDGKVKRGSYWTEAGILPRSPELACSGYNCGCSLVPTKEPVTPGALPKLQGPERSKEAATPPPPAAPAAAEEQQPDQEDKFTWKPGDATIEDLTPEELASLDPLEDELEEGGPGSGPQGGDGDDKPAPKPKRPNPPGHLSVKGAKPLTTDQQREDFEQSPANQAWSAALPPECVESISSYGFHGYRQINGQLRSGQISTDPDYGGDKSSDIANIDRAMASAPPLETPLVTYRGMSADMFGDRTPEELIGKRVSDKGFISTTTALDYAESWQQGTSPILATIRVPTGARGIAMNSVKDKGIYHAENEFLLPRGSKFVVRKWGKDSKGRITVSLDLFVLNPKKE